jgi:hypothetical protein
MSNVKVQSTKSTNETQNLKNFKYQNQKQSVSGIRTFGIHLAFACLGEAPPAKVLCGGQAFRRRQEF